MIETWTEALLDLVTQYGPSVSYALSGLLAFALTYRAARGAWAWATRPAPLSPMALNLLYCLEHGEGWRPKDHVEKGRRTYRYVENATLGCLTWADRFPGYENSGDGRFLTRREHRAVRKMASALYERLRDEEWEAARKDVLSRSSEAAARAYKATAAAKPGADRTFTFQGRQFAVKNGYVYEAEQAA